MNEDRIWILIARKLTGEASAIEQMELNELLQDDPIMQARFKLITEFWNYKEPSAENKPAVHLNFLDTRL